jgi:hypothetical protein
MKMENPEGYSAVSKLPVFISPISYKNPFALPEKCEAPEESPLRWLGVTDSFSNPSGLVRYKIVGNK